MFFLERKNIMAIVKKKNEDIVQSNHLIEAHYRLSLQEKRLILWLIKHIKPQDQDLKRYTIKVSDYAEMMGLDVKTQYAEMRKITKSLLTKVIEFSNPQLRKKTRVTWLCFDEWEEGKGICSLEIHPELKPHLLQLKGHFTQIPFSHFLGLKSCYSIRIFELLIQYESIGKRTMKITDIKKWCGLCEEEYSLYGHLKKRVLDKAKSEINATTDYDIDYKENKESRKVVAIEWSIKKKKVARILSDASGSRLFLVKSIMEYGFGKVAAQRMTNTHEESVVRNALEAVDIQVSKGKAKNPKAMLQTALKEQWKP